MTRKPRWFKHKEHGFMLIVDVDGLDAVITSLCLNAARQTLKPMREVTSC